MCLCILENCFIDFFIWKWQYYGICAIIYKRKESLTIFIRYTLNSFVFIRIIIQKIIDVYIIALLID